MRTRMICLAVTLATLAMTPLSVLANAQDDAAKIPDGRLVGYERAVALDSGSSALVWLLLVLLGAICLGVLFKHAKRTHLD